MAAGAAAGLDCRGRLRRLRHADHNCRASIMPSSGLAGHDRQRKGRARRSAALTEAGWTSVHLSVAQGRSGSRHSRRAVQQGWGDGRSVRRSTALCRNR